MVFLISAFCMGGTLLWAKATTAGPVQAGVAAAVKGDVRVTTVESEMHPLKSGDKVYMGDVIETGDDGQLQVLLLDQTVFTLGPLSSIKMDEFVYDPATDDGKVKASMVKGIFRFVSGKIAHKKPENMEVTLPAGSIGIRGTIVAGIIDGAKSLVVLLGPVGGEGVQPGRIYVSNVVNGEVVGVDIDQSGNATIVDGPNSAPVPVFQVSEADLSRIAAALGQQMTKGETSGESSGGAAGAGSSVDAKALMDLLTTMDQFEQTSQTAAQDIAENAGKSREDKHEDNSHSGNYSVGKG